VGQVDRALARESTAAADGESDALAVAYSAAFRHDEGPQRRFAPGKGESNGSGAGPGGEAPLMVKKARPNLLRRLNERTVFELIRRRGPTSRADLRRRMGVSAPTVSKAVAHLLDAGLLEKVGLAPARGVGRPVVVYRLAQGSARLVGAAVGVRRCVIVSAGLDGIIDEQKTIIFNTPRNYGALIDAIVDATRKISGRGGNTRGIGVSVPGAVDARQQRVLLSPNLHFLNGRSPARDLHARLGIETALVHDVAAACLAEQQYGAARDMSDFVLVGVYEGFGVAVVTGGAAGCRAQRAGR
jgi:N-acetylglucosamine repressor